MLESGEVVVVCVRAGGWVGGSSMCCFMLHKCIIFERMNLQRDGNRDVVAEIHLCNLEKK